MSCHAQPVLRTYRMPLSVHSSSALKYVKGCENEELRLRAYQIHILQVALVEMTCFDFFLCSLL